ncbi:MAG: hypothetical protein K0B01_04355 [Syntrophobacterales bacterium]|nr:hypothetical protein [Syntrophobacterales bacterium]
MIRIKIFAIIFLFLGLSGCGGLRYSEISPDARDFHPRKIVVLPADVAAFPEAAGSVDRLFTEALTERRWFEGVLGGEGFAKRLRKDEELRGAVAGYLEKLTKVKFSDPDLSSRIGSLTGTEAFLVNRVDSWIYTVVNDKKAAKVGLSITLVEAKTGKILWSATHSRVSEYLLVKPELANMARGLIREMTDQMPH